MALSLATSQSQGHSANRKKKSTYVTLRPRYSHVSCFAVFKSQIMKKEIRGVGRSDALEETASAVRPVPESRFIPGSGWIRPRIQRLFLFPALGKLLLSVTHLVALEYSDPDQIHSTVATVVVTVIGMPALLFFFIGFRSP